MYKTPLKLTGRITKIGELEEIRRVTPPMMLKRMLKFETEDGQVFFPELRNRKLKILEENQIQDNTLVEISIIFDGSEKKGRSYNNISITDIQNI